MIDPQRAIRDVRANLRESVLPELHSSHARAILASSLGILDELAGRVRLDEAPARATVAEMLPAVEEWIRELRGKAPQDAEFLEACRRRAEAQTTPAEAREAVLSAAERVIELAWSEPDRPTRERTLRRARPLLRADVERQRGRDLR